MSPFETIRSRKARQTALLPDGRRLGYADTGDESLPPVFYFHGFPGSRLEASFLTIPGARLIGVDRPGYGLSTPLRGRTLRGFAADIAALADHLGIGSFGVMGVSGGGPYAAICARMLPDRVAAAALVCPLGPPEAPAMRRGRLKLLTDLGRRPVSRAVLFRLGRAIMLDDRLVRRALAYRARMPRASADQALMRGEMGQLMLESWREALNTGIEGISADARIYGTPWGWRLAELRVPVYLWHGEADIIVPPSVGRYYAERVPGIESHFSPDDGHFSVVLNHRDDIIQRLVSHL